MSANTPPVGHWVEDWLSPARFAAYVAECRGDRDRALALYEWNASVSAAFYRDLGHLEVALRNAYDRAITARWRGQQHWLVDPSGPTRIPLVRHGTNVNARAQTLADDAVKRAGGVNAPPGKIIAELSFGWWRYLTSRAHEKTLWVPYLHHAYPRGTNRADVDLVVVQLHALRNRVAHLEPLFPRPLLTDHGRLLWLCEKLNPTLADFLRGSSTVVLRLQARP